MPGCSPADMRSTDPSVKAGDRPCGVGVRCCARQEPGGVGVFSEKSRGAAVRTWRRGPGEEKAER